MNRNVKRITPVHQVKSCIRLPGSKSITHRALLIAALSRGKSILRNALKAEDTLLTARALELLGSQVIWNGVTVMIVPPEQHWITPDAPILLGNSGTSIRLLLALAATGTGTFIFDGSSRLRERPVGPVLDALRRLGVTCHCLQNDGFPPVRIVSKGLQGGEVLIDARQSSQFLSALLLASPCARSDVTIGWIEPVASFPYVAITLSMLEQAGIHYQWLGNNRLVIPAPQSYPPLDYLVEGDCSSASYFWGAAAITGGEVTTHPVSRDSLQGDCRFLDILAEMGCTLAWEEHSVKVKGPPHLLPVDRDMNTMPDMVPTLAVLAAFAAGRTRITNVAHLRMKESDRLSVVASELKKLSIPVEELPDGLIIEGGKALPPKEAIEAHDDHRIAMAFAMAGLRLKEVTINGADAVAKSFPGFWDVFEQLRIT